MNDKLQEMIIELCNILGNSTVEFLNENIYKDHLMKDMINLISSAFFTTMFNLMRLYSKGDNELLTHINGVIEDIKKFLHSIAKTQEGME